MTDAIPNAAFVIFNFGEGRGGHYLSMRETIISGIFVDPLVIDLGFQPTPTLDGLRSNFIRHGWTGHYAARRALREAATKAGSHVVFCYDIQSYNITAHALAGTPAKVVYVKCGGPCLTLYYPRPQALIVFSDEDDAFFAQRLPRAMRAKIPNRVSESALANKQIPLAEEAGAWLHSNSAAENIVCVARFSHSYTLKIQRAVAYLNSRRKAGHAATLTLTGYVEHKEVFDEITDSLGPDDDVQILSDPFHTLDAGRFLSNFDTAITTGRGTVEAVLCGLKVFVPYDGGRQLALLTPDTYHGLLRSNFSGRASPEEIGQSKNRDETSSGSETLLKRIRSDFAIESAGPKFRAFVEQLRPNYAPNARARILDQTYFFYVALSSKVPILRIVLNAIRSQRTLEWRPSK